MEILDEQHRRTRVRGAFTLVELLVVIGIIALLISILLPAIAGARRQANQAKCATQMKQLYMGYLLYAADNKDYWPAGRVTLDATVYAPASNKRYSVGAVDFPTDGTGSARSRSIYFYDFIAKYLTRSKQGVASQTAEEATYARTSILWACPSWTGFLGTDPGGINRSQVGIGANLWPTMTAKNPATGDFPPNAERNYIDFFGNTATQVGRWYKSTLWTRNGSNRLLLADSRLYLAESRAMPASGVFPPQSNLNNEDTYTSGVAGQTIIDVYRHGKYPGQHPTINKAFDTNGGKVAYNILYADGHVAMENDRRAAYESVRQRFPG